MPSYVLNYHYEAGEPFSETLEATDSVVATMEARRREARLRRMIVGVVGISMASASGHPLLDTRGGSPSPRVPAESRLGLIPSSLAEYLCAFGHDAKEC